MAKIAVALEQALAHRTLTGAAGRTSGRLLAQGEGWKAEDVICTHGPHDRSFEEQHKNYTIALVAAGSFQYRGDHGRELMTAGSILLGRAGEGFECRHDHGSGDRCVAFSYTPEYFERLAADAGGKGSFAVLRLPPMRAFSPLMARACAGLFNTTDVPWEEIGLELASQTVQMARNGGVDCHPTNSLPSSEARVTRVLRRIERHISDSLDVSIANLAREAGLSPYHFLRTFEAVTGVTPHQYIMRVRLREAAVRLAAEPERVLDIAYDCCFRDVSNFNRAFRMEFGVSPKAYRRSRHASVMK
ncbi:MAG TPA: AraC family transcriptional regulator [Candidatus Sulfotelmatobacter sp.]|nr:AraC family transcriptional regulator [Candidatus Sulfotelmatobacter sp.]